MFGDLIAIDIWKNSVLDGPQGPVLICEQYDDDLTAVLSIQSVSCLLILSLSAVCAQLSLLTAPPMSQLAAA